MYTNYTIRMREAFPAKMKYVLLFLYCKRNAYCSIALNSRIEKVIFPPSGEWKNISFSDAT